MPIAPSKSRLPCRPRTACQEEGPNTLCAALKRSARYQSVAPDPLTLGHNALWKPSIGGSAMFTSTFACVMAAVLVSTRSTPTPVDHRILASGPPPRVKRAPSSKGISFEKRRQSEQEIADAIARLNVPKMDLPPGGVQAGPLICRQPLHDFGTFWAGGMISHAFVLENICDVAIEVDLIAGSGTSSKPTRSIPPRGSLELPISLKTEALHDRFTKTVRVRIVKVGQPVHISNLFEIQAARWLWNTFKPIAARLKANLLREFRSTGSQSGMKEDPQRTQRAQRRNRSSLCVLCVSLRIVFFSPSSDAERSRAARRRFAAFSRPIEYAGSRDSAALQNVPIQDRLLL
ncbi:MAG: hypothetical protein IT449_01005 [Phycisphaerales bacterium]|nr:hypothetical protein [Phycisphaerales bacterium]